MRAIAMRLRRLCNSASILFLIYSGACTGKSPTAPAPPPIPAAPITAAAIFLTPNTWDLPAGGGSIEITIATAASATGNVVAPNVEVALSASSGTLSDTAARTDHTGHAKVAWTGTSGATIVARAGDVQSTATFRVPAAAPTPPPSPPNPPSPPPPGGPNPPLPPNPPNPPPPIPPGDGPAGDLVATIVATPANPDAGQTVTFSVTLASTTGAAIPAIDRYTWDLNGDRLPDHVEARPTSSYPAGTVRIDVEIFTADHRVVLATLMLVVGETPALTATIAAAPASVGLGELVTLTATATPTGNVGTISYRWDFDGNGTIDQTTAAPSTTTAYATIGAKARRSRSPAAGAARPRPGRP